ncbi:MAG TPA: WecB/TagA/CpsF family glycosyltransferase, partial [Limnobacter sp.]|nr:WecB/TagA/CpsF family glycosyltransferase [Limnobacter sp.]
MNIVRKTLFDIEFSAVTQQQAVQAILAWTGQDDGKPRRVVTPNVNLTLLQKRNPEFRRVLNESSLCVVDGKPIYWASRLFKVDLPEVVTGSDLVPAVFAAHELSPGSSELKVFLLGAGEGVAARAARRITARYSRVQVCGVYSPPFGFEHDADECRNICELIRNTGADLLVVGLGAPKQELWTARHQQETGVPVAICAGATIDFLAGEKSRAPAWMTRSGLEWLFRMLSEPRRLAKRYVKDG